MLYTIHSAFFFRRAIQFCMLKFLSLHFNLRERYKRKSLNNNSKSSRLCLFISFMTDHNETNESYVSNKKTVDKARYIYFIFLNWKFCFFKSLLNEVAKTRIKKKNIFLFPIRQFLFHKSSVVKKMIEKQLT